MLLTDDPAIQELNRHWRGVDAPTDVLSWAQEEAPAGAAARTAPGAEDILGDVVISLDTAARQARARDWDLDEEVALLLVHGILHLLGYEDETEAGAESMRNQERQILGKPLEKVGTLSEGTISA